MILMALRLKKIEEDSVENKNLSNENIQNAAVKNNSPESSQILILDSNKNPKPQL